MAGRNRRRRRTALLAALVLHAGLLAPLWLVAPRLRMAQPPNAANMLLGLVPEAKLGIAAPRASAARPAAIQPAHAPRAPGQASRPPLAPSAAGRSSIGHSDSPPAPGATRAAPPGDAATPAAADAASQDAVRRALRAALACAPSNAQNLDDTGRAACGKRLREAAAAMGEAKVDTIPPLKRAYYDAVQKAYQDIRHAPTPDTTLTHLPGAASMYDQRLASIRGRPPMAGCGLKFGGPKGAKSAGAPPHSLYFKLGPVICGVTPPQGVLTEESATPNADDVP